MYSVPGSRLVMVKSYDTDEDTSIITAPSPSPVTEFTVDRLGEMVSPSKTKHFAVPAFEGDFAVYAPPPAF